MSTFTLYVKAGNSPQSIRVLEYLDRAITDIKTRTNITMAITVITSQQLSTPATVAKLRDAGINGIPAMVTPNGVIHSADTIMAKFKSTLDGISAARAASNRDPADQIERMQMRTLSGGLEDSDNEDSVREDRKGSNTSLRDPNASNRIATALARREQAGIPSVAAKLQQASRGPARGPSRGPSRESQQDAPAPAQHFSDDEGPNNPPPPGRTSGSALRGKLANQGSTPTEGNRVGNLQADSGDDDDAVDRILLSISRTNE